MLTNETKLLFVRLPEAEKRRIKIMAASEGLTLGQAIHEAFDAWTAHLQSRGRTPDLARGSSAGADSGTPHQPDRAAAGRRDRRPAGRKPSSTAVTSQVPKLEVSSGAFLRKAAQLDWSKCPVAQKVQGKSGNVWVVRGTDAPLADLLQSIADGHPFMEIAEVFEITLAQLIAVLQFAAERLAPASPGR